MTIILYKNNSPANYVTKQLTLYYSMEGTLRKPTSLTDPVVTLLLQNPVGFNYVRIPEFNRYYFVKGISTEYGGLVAVSMHVDVLMSYSDAIRNADAVVKRNENRWNLYLDDGIFKSYQNTKHKTIPFPVGFTGESFILALAGNS